MALKNYGELFVQTWWQTHESASGLQQKKAIWVFCPKNFNFANKKLRNGFFSPEKKILRDKIQEERNKNRGRESRTTCITRTLIFAWNRLQSRIYAPQGIPELLCVCVSPREGPPEGILDIPEYIVCWVVFVLFLFWGPKFFRQRAPSIYVAKKMRKKEKEWSRKKGVFTANRNQKFVVICSKKPEIARKRSARGVLKVTSGPCSRSNTKN